MTNTTETTGINVLAVGTTRKVHIAWSSNHQALCNRSHCGTVIADLEDNGGQPDTIAALKAANIAPSRLCGNCFYSAFRMAYRAAR